MIPKRIFTMWFSFNGDPIPEMIQSCINSQKLDGYEHIIITEKNVELPSDYVEICLGKAKRLSEANDRSYTKWIVKASDYLRLWYVNKYGGIYLDADVEIINGKNFNDLLDNKIFVGREKSKYVAGSVLGAEKDNPFFTELMKSIDDNFKPEGDMVWEPGMKAFGDKVWKTNKEDNSIKVLESEFFFPYNHETGMILITPNTIACHHFYKSWV